MDVPIPLHITLILHDLEMQGPFQHIMKGGPEGERWVAWARARSVMIHAIGGRRDATPNGRPVHAYTITGAGAKIFNKNDEKKENERHFPGFLFATGSYAFSLLLSRRTAHQSITEPYRIGGAGNPQSRSSRSVMWGTRAGLLLSCQGRLPRTYEFGLRRAPLQSVEAEGECDHGPLVLGGTAVPCCAVLCGEREGADESEVR